MTRLGYEPTPRRADGGWLRALGVGPLLLAGAVVAWGTLPLAAVVGNGPLATAGLWLFATLNPLGFVAGLTLLVLEVDRGDINASAMIAYYLTGFGTIITLVAGTILVFG